MKFLFNFAFLFLVPDTEEEIEGYKEWWIESSKTLWWVEEAIQMKEFPNAVCSSCSDECFWDHVAMGFGSINTWQVSHVTSSNSFKDRHTFGRGY